MTKQDALRKKENLGLARSFSDVETFLTRSNEKKG